MVSSDCHHQFYNYCKTDDSSRMKPKRFYCKIIIILNMKLLLSFIFTVKILAQINIYKYAPGFYLTQNNCTKIINQEIAVWRH